MSEEANLDEAANTTLLLEQHIHEKIMRALVDVALPDAHRSYVHRAMDSGSSGDVASYEFRRVYVLSLINDYTFQQNLRQMVVAIVREEVAAQVRSQMELERSQRRAIVNTATQNSVIYR